MKKPQVIEEELVLEGGGVGGGEVASSKISYVVPPTPLAVTWSRLQPSWPKKQHKNVKKFQYSLYNSLGNWWENIDRHHMQLQNFWQSASIQP